MSSTKYGKDFAVPKDFPSVLKAFTREVLRNQPENIYEFGAQYFTEVLAQLQDEQAQQGSSMQRLTPAELAEMLQTLFHQADKDGSGTLSRQEFEVVSLKFPSVLFPKLAKKGDEETKTLDSGSQLMLE